MAEVELVAPAPKIELVKPAPKGPPPGFPFGLGGRGELGAGPPEKERRDEERRKAQQQRQKILEDTAGGEFDPEGTFQAEGLNEFFASADLARSTGDQRLNEMRDKFQQGFPEGEIRFAKTGDDVVAIARKSPDEPFRELGGLSQIVGQFASEPVVGSIAGSAGGPLGTFAGVAAGEQVKSEVERFRGFERDPRSKVAGRGARVAGIEAVIDLATRGTLGRFFSTGELAEKQLKALQAASEEGLPQLTTGQIAKSPLVRAMFTQASGTSPVLQELTAKQQGALLKRFEDLSRGSLSGVSDKSLEKVIAAQNQRLSRLMTPEGITKEQAGRALQRGLENYRKAGRQWVGRKYDDAIREAGEDVVFDSTRLKQMAELVEGGTPVRTSQGIVRGEGDLTPEIQRVLNVIKTLPDEVGTQTVAGRQVTGFEQLKALRTRLFDLKESLDGDARGSAKRLWSALTDTMNAPIGGGEEFVRKWRAASQANRLLEDRLSETVVANALKTDQLGQLASKYIRPGQFRELQLIKRIIPEENWEVFRNRFKEDVLLDPEGGLKKLNRFATDRRTLRLMVSEKEENLLREYAKEASRIESAPVRKIFEENLSRGERALKLANEGSSEELSSLVQLAGGKESELAASMRAGIYQRILDRHVSTDQFNREILDAIGLTRDIQKLQRSGRLDPLFRAEDWKAINNLRSYTSFVGQSIDVGGLLQKGEVVSGITDVFRPERVRRALQIVGRNEVMASILSKPGSRAFKQLEASGGPVVDERRLRAAILATTTAMQQ